MNREKRKIGLRAKIIFSFLLVGSVPVIVGLGVTYWSGTSKLRVSMGENFQGLAMEASRKADLVIEKEILSKQHLTTALGIREEIEASNRIYRGMDRGGIDQRLARNTLRWTGEGDPAWRNRLLASEVSENLRNYMATKGEKYLAFFVTDEKGAVVASANGFPDYLHGSQEWWTRTYNGGSGRIYIGDLYFNDKAQTYALNIAVPVMDREGGRVIGVLVVYHDIRRLLDSTISVIRFGATGHAMLIDSRGQVLVCPVMPTGSYLADSNLVGDVTSATPKWVLAADDGHGGRDSIIGFSPLVRTSAITSDSTGKTWHAFIRQDPRELYAPINSLLESVFLAGIILIGSVVILGFAMSGRLTRPIRQLQAGAEAIGKGNLDVEVAVHTNDEIEQLATEFNQMAQKLKESYSSLEHKVADRTRELSALNLIATTVNQSLEMREILENALAKILEVIQLEGGGIWLWDEARKSLVLRVSRGWPSDFVRKYGALSISGPGDGANGEGGALVSVSDYSGTEEAVRALAETGFHSPLVVRLQSKNMPLGCLTVTGRAPRTYTRQEKDLLVAVGNQLSIAIENATLYTETRGMVAQLKEADRFKTEFFSNVSHEFRTPLTSIIGYSEFLLEEIDSGLTAKQRESIINIQDSGTLLLENINNLLDLSRLKANRMELHLGEFSVRSLVSSCMKAVRPMAEKKGLKLVSVAQEENLVAFADEIKVKQILLNLLSNAVKFSHPKGTITLEARSSVLDGSTAVEISVTDTGIGIREGDLKRIFEEFRQADSSYTREYGGSGLGLVIAKWFAEMHGGEIRVESQFHKGSRFSLVLPQKPDPERLEAETV